MTTNPSPETVETMARAICDEEWDGPQPWDRKPESFKNRYRSYARAAYAALAAAPPSAGEGWVLVPRHAGSLQKSVGSDLLNEWAPGVPGAYDMAHELYDRMVATPPLPRRVTP